MKRELFVVIIYTLSFVWAEAPMVRNYLDAYDSRAICNDGTVAVTYTRVGSGEGANKFIIRLQGGGWCYDEDSCTSRLKDSPYWTTSSVCPDQMFDNTTISGVAHQGITSSNASINPHFYNWNHVYVWYCSSDSHIGNISSSVKGWGFNGKNIVAATMELVIDKMNLAAATDVLLTGDSAGGVATVNNADFIGSYVYKVAPNVNYRAFIDCAWFLNIPAYGSGFMYFQNIAKNLLTNANVRYDDSCVAALGDDQWMCFHTHYTYLKTMSFYAEFQFDSANLGMDSCPEPFDSQKETYALNFQQSMLEAQAKVPYLFSASCYLHETIDSNYFSLIKIGNYTISDTVAEWFNSGSYSSPPPISRYLDSCSGISCNPTCKVPQFYPTA